MMKILPLLLLVVASVSIISALKGEDETCEDGDPAARKEQREEEGPSLFRARLSTSTKAPQEDASYDRDLLRRPISRYHEEHWSYFDGKTADIKICPLLPFDMSDSAFPEGTTLTVTCPEGFEFVTAAPIPTTTSTTCRRDGTWTRSQLGTCKKRIIIRYCDNPPKIGNSIIAETILVQVETAQPYQTYVHQYISQKNVITRVKRHSDNNNWPPKVYEVIEGGATGPQRPLSTQLIRYTIGSSVRYACEPGYRLEGASDRIYCRYPDWTKAPFCARICYAPDTPPYALIDRQLTSEDGFEFPVNGFITYKCIDDGFRLVGEPKIKCTSSGNWTSPLPMCRPKVVPKVEVIECVTPDPPPNSAIVAQVVGQTIDRHPVSGYIRYKCMPGYQFPEGVQSTITCQPDGMWNFPAPTCQPVPTQAPVVPFECEAPPIPPNGMILRQFTSYQVNHRYPVGGYIEYVCNEPHELFGERTITCTYSGWSSNPPTCQMTCSEPQLGGAANVVIKLKPQKRSPSGQYPADSVYELACAPGYQLINGSLTLKCLTSGRWHPQHIYPICRRVNPDSQMSEIKTVCGEPPTMIFGFVKTCSQLANNGRYPLGAIATYTCADNYTMVGNSTYICGEDGFWLPQGSQYETYCELTCPLPVTPQFGQVVERSKFIQEMGRFQHGAHIRYNCTMGGRLIGDETIWCHEGGNWSSRPPFCQVACAVPPTPSNAHIVFQSDSLPIPINEYGELDTKNARFLPGSYTRYACDDGYNNIDPDLDTIYCRNGGQWVTRQNKDIGEICLFFPNWMSQK